MFKYSGIFVSKIEVVNTATRAGRRKKKNKKKKIRAERKVAGSIEIDGEQPQSSDAVLCQCGRERQ